MSFAYIQPIFCPNGELFLKNERSIHSFIEYYNKMKYDFQCVFGGYCQEDVYYAELEKVIKGSIKNSIVIRLDRNYGKAYVVNLLSKLINEDVKYFLTADSDIIFHYDQPNIKDRLVEAFNHSNNIGQPAGVIGLSQDEHNCHILELCHQMRYYYNDNTEMICRPMSGGGMAGGCLCISVETWKAVGGYKVMGVYASDDATLLKDCVSIGKHFFLSNSIRCIHPYEKNSEYQNWKVRTVGNIGNLEDSISEADIFWNK